MATWGGTLHCNSFLHATLIKCSNWASPPLRCLVSSTPSMPARASSNLLRHSCLAQRALAASTYCEAHTGSHATRSASVPARAWLLRLGSATQSLWPRRARAPPSAEHGTAGSAVGTPEPGACGAVATARSKATLSIAVQGHQRPGTSHPTRLHNTTSTASLPRSQNNLFLASPHAGTPALQSFSATAPSHWGPATSTEHRPGASRRVFAAATQTRAACGAALPAERAAAPRQTRTCCPSCARSQPPLPGCPPRSAPRLPGACAHPCAEARRGSASRP